MTCERRSLGTGSVGQKTLSRRSPDTWRGWWTGQAGHPGERPEAFQAYRERLGRQEERQHPRGAVSAVLDRRSATAARSRKVRVRPSARRHLLNVSDLLVCHLPIHHSRSSP